jgi:N-acyl-phosphatidylethanolamine-hydrolysing phospholipase D
MLKRCNSSFILSKIRSLPMSTAPSSLVNTKVTPDPDSSLPRHVYKNGVFETPFSWKHKTFSEMMNFMFCYKQNHLALGLNDNRSLIKVTPVESKIKHPMKSDDETPTASWLGHASMLFRADGMTFLTDPVFSERCSPVQFAGPKRFTPVPDGVDDIHIDVVLLSHTHYDHLDSATATKIGNKALWISPRGVKKLLNEYNITNCIEMDWWDSYEYMHPDHSATSTISFVPANHWTNRGMLDINTCLWGGYVVKTTKSSFFFMGDSGYDENLFKIIGNKFGPFDISALGIGAYRPREFMREQHVNPAEAVQIHQELQSRQSVGIHWGTFPLALEDDIEPALEMNRARKMAGLDHTEFFTMIQGETINVSKGIKNGMNDIGNLHPDIQDIFETLPVHKDDSDILKWPFKP